MAVSLGVEHPDALTNRANLADWTGQAEDAAAARDQYAELVPVIERALGAEHPRTLTPTPASPPGYAASKSEARATWSCRMRAETALRQGVVAREVGSGAGFENR
jgi:plasmid stabilization system protein ParE